MSGLKQQKVFWDDGGETIKRFHEVDAVLACDYDRDTQALRAEIERYIQEGIKIADQRDELRAQVEVMMPALEKISAYAPCSGVKDPGFTKMYMGILARDAIAAALQEPKP